MPTPMPIIAANCGLNSGKSAKFAPSPITEKPAPSAKIAAPSGSPMAITDPNAISRMSTAASSP